MSSTKRPTTKTSKRSGSKKPGKTAKKRSSKTKKKRPNKRPTKKSTRKTKTAKKRTSKLAKSAVKKAPAKRAGKKPSNRVRVATAKSVATAAVARARSGSRRALGSVGLKQAAGSALHTRACDLFGVKYPIVQTGMGWVSGAKLTAATSEAGGLGILAAATMTFGELDEAIGKVKDRTKNPFGVNLRADQADVLDRVDLLIRQGVRVASFAQAPGKQVIDKLKDAGLITMPTIGARRHAEKVQDWGVDAVIAQGHEGGGHTGQVPTSLLMPQVVDAVDIPVIAAGGFYDGRGLVSALAYGCSGIAMGTRFLLTQESGVPDHVKEIYLKTKVNGTVVTKAVDGYPQRVIRTKLIEQLEKVNPLVRFPLAAKNALSLMRITGTTLPDMIEEGLAMKQSKELTWAQLAMAANAPMLTKAGVVDGQIEAGILPTGQVTGVIDELPTVQQLIERIVKEAEQTLSRLSA